MKIFSGKQIYEADEYTIANEPIASIYLMERAALALSEWIALHIDVATPLFFIVGRGNNGGDGLAMARILSAKGYKCAVWMALGTKGLSDACRINFERLPNSVKSVDSLMPVPNAIVVDALFGAGLNRPLESDACAIVNDINKLDNRIIAIDLPSGLMCHFMPADQTVVCAETTLTIQFPKLTMLLPDYGNCCGHIENIPIGLSDDFLQQTDTPYYYTTKSTVEKRLLRRQKFDYKNNHGHALLVCGSRGMIGAALLATKAALRSGCGLVTLHLPHSERSAVYVAAPSAMLSLDEGDNFSQLPTQLERYTTIGVGCGIGQADETKRAFAQLLKVSKQALVLDADALNILASTPELREYVPQGSILTPHEGELRRLVGEWGSQEEKIALVRELAAMLRSVIVVKGAHSMVCLPDGQCHFNSTGNAGMAKGGSGDVLTGFLTGLLARGYSAESAAIIGVYLHGLAGDKATEKWGVEAMNSHDIIDFLVADFSNP